MPHWTKKVPKTVDDVVEGICNLEGAELAGARPNVKGLRRLTFLLFEIREQHVDNQKTFHELLELR